MSETQRQGLRGRRIGYVAQSAAASFNPAMTILDQVCEVLVTTGMSTVSEAREEAVRLFRELDLPNPETFGNRFPHQVSGGQLQRAMAAMAMAPRPAVLVFDEPTTALDVTTQVEVLAAIQKLIRLHNTAAIHISHDLAVVAQLADFIMVLRRGRVVEFGRTHDILNNPQQDYTRRLIGEKSTSYLDRDRSSDSAPLLSLKGVTASYKSLPNVVHGVDLEVQRGSTMAIIGESGSGKSTLARVIVGLLPRQAGSIRFAESELSPDVRHRTRDQLRRIQMIYQVPDVALNPRHTVFETIGRPIRFYFNASRSQVKNQVADLLAQVEMPLALMSRKTSTLSGGQKQRLCIARALAARPDLIICDEVTSALDQLVAEEVLALLRRLQRAHNMALLFITHDLGIVQRFSNNVTVMQKGRVLEQGATAKVFSPPLQEYMDLLLSSVPQLRAGWLNEAIDARVSRGRNAA
jgi:peptide/nickel transport system ATP-binding protein